MFGLSIFGQKEQKKSDDGYSLGLSAREALSLACSESIRTEITVLGRLGSHDSVLLGYDEGLNSFFVKPIKTIDGEPSMTPNQTVVRFYFDLHGVRRMFRSIFLGVMKWNGATVLRFEIPELMEVIQRREFFRVSPNPAHPVQVSVKRGGMSKNKAIDISVGGLSFDFTIKLATAQKIPVSIKLPTNDRSFTTDVRTKGVHVVKTVDYRQRLALLTNKLALQPTYKVRAEFIHLSLSESQMVERYIANRQRDTLRSII